VPPRVTPAAAPPRPLFKLPPQPTKRRPGVARLERHGAAEGPRANEVRTAGRATSRKGTPTTTATATAATPRPTPSNLTSKQPEPTALSPAAQPCTRSYSIAPLAKSDRAIAARAKSVWVLDSDSRASHCMGCASFEFWNVGPAQWRRHHCRSCGWVVCAGCLAPEPVELDRWVSSTKGHEVRHGAPTKAKKVCRQHASW
jgi:hypothetical protein